METLGLICFLGITAVDDLKTRQIKVLEIIIFGVIGILFNFIFKWHTATSLFGGIIVGCVMFLFSVLSGEKIGKGDGLVVMVTGLYLGFANTLSLVWISSILAAIIGGLYVKKYSVDTDIELPFIPFLLMGYLVLIVVNSVGGLGVCG